MATVELRVWARCGNTVWRGREDFTVSEGLVEYLPEYVSHACRYFPGDWEYAGCDILDIRGLDLQWTDSFTDLEDLIDFISYMEQQGRMAV